MNTNHHYQKIYPPILLSLLVIWLLWLFSINAVHASQNLSEISPTIHCQNETCDSYNQLMKRHGSSPAIQTTGCHYWRLKLRAQSINCERCDQCLRMKFYLYGSPSCYYCLRLKYLLSRSPSCHRCLRLKVLLHLNPSCQTSTCELCRRGISPEARCLGDDRPNPKHPLRRTRPEPRRSTSPEIHRNHRHYHDLPVSRSDDDKDFDDEDDDDFLPRHRSKEIHHHRHHFPKREEETHHLPKHHHRVMHHHNTETHHFPKHLPEKEHNLPKTEPKKHHLRKHHMPGAQLDEHHLPKTKKPRKHHHLHESYTPPAPNPRDQTDPDKTVSEGPMSAPLTVSQSTTP